MTLEESRCSRCSKSLTLTKPCKCGNLLRERTLHDHRLLGQQIVHIYGIPHYSDLFKTGKPYHVDMKQFIWEKSEYSSLMFTVPKELKGIYDSLVDTINGLK